MANDREVLREIWEGKLPICFELNSEDVFGLKQPDKIYLMVPRLSYFPLVLDKVKKHFIRYVSNDKNDQDLWLEYNGQPLKWHYPIGVLFDIHIGSDVNLPWNIIVHFEKFPNTIFKFNNKELVESYFLSCLKEADILKHKQQIVTNMLKKDHNQLWLGLQNDKFDQFWAINRKLMEVSDEQNYFKHIPFRCYYNEGYIQRLVKPVTDDGNVKTLDDLLSELFPDKQVYVRTHGIVLPSDIPLQWMSEHLSYPDNFLHLIVI